MSESFKPMKILFVTSEVAPLSKVGGLGDVAWALPRELNRLGHDVRVFSPKYGIIDENKFKTNYVLKDLTISTSKEKLICNVKTTKIPGNILVYLLENKEYYEQRANVYGYSDDARRWYILSRAVLEFLKECEWKPDIVHSHDWTAGLVSNFMRTLYKKDKDINKIASVFTIHNLNHQGMFNFWEQKESEKDDGKRRMLDFYSDDVHKMNGIRRGIIYSDIITTVSENYSREILTPQYGAGLDKLLKEERMKLFGVINGLDYRVFNPKTDPDIWFNFDRNSIENKVKNKLAFQKEFGLEENPDIPLLGFVGRFSSQKGLDLIKDTFDDLLNNLDFQFAVVGSGAEKYLRYFDDLMKRYPKRVGGHLMISKIIGQQIYAASDIFIYPSQFEPCGLAHLIAMKYGSIPIVRSTGGLADTVEAYNPKTGEGNGFIFDEFDKNAFMIQVIRALESYKHEKEWLKLQHKVMGLNFSWKTSAVKYAELYEKAIERHKRWLIKEGLLKPQYPEEVMGKGTVDHSR